MTSILIQLRLFQSQTNYNLASYLCLFSNTPHKKENMKNRLLLVLLFICLLSSQNLFSQSVLVKNMYTEQKCDELIHRLSDSLMQIPGDVSENYLKINEMTNRVTHQFILEFEKDLGKPIIGDDLKYLVKQSKKCINEPSKTTGANVCSSCLGSGYRACEYCHGRASEPCKVCNATGTILVGGNRVPDNACNGMGYLNCLYCSGRGDLKCATCNGSGHVK